MFGDMMCFRAAFLSSNMCSIVFHVSNEYCFASADHGNASDSKSGDCLSHCCRQLQGHVPTSNFSSEYSEVC